MYYFNQFPQILYTFDENLFEYSSVVNIFARVKVLNSVLENALVYYEYPVKDSDTAPIIAFKYYGDALRHWMVYFANDVVDPYFDMPLNNFDLQNNIIEKYGSLANAQITLHSVVQYVNVTTSLAGTSNTISYQSTLQQPFTYDFTKNTLQPVTLPSIEYPEIDQGTSVCTLPDGSVVTTHTVWVAINAYDYYMNQNEEKRTVKLLDSQYAAPIEQQFQQLMNSST
jgi:hypothetical protein